jgi:hypothetical protein
MVAFVLWYLLGWHAAAAELGAELLIGLLLWRGGGGRRLRATARELFGRRGLAAAASTLSLG